MSKVDIGAKVFSNPFMVAKLFPVVRCDGMGSSWQRPQELNHSICHSLSSLALNLSQERQTRFALGQ